MSHDLFSLLLISQYLTCLWIQIFTVYLNAIFFLCVQDVQYESLEPLYNMKHFVPRYEFNSLYTDHF